MMDQERLQNENKNPTFDGGDNNHLMDNYAEFKAQRLSVAMTARHASIQGDENAAKLAQR
jgi:hypothetical protein